MAVAVRLHPVERPLARPVKKPRSGSRGQDADFFGAPQTISLPFDSGS